MSTTSTKPAKPPKPPKNAAPAAVTPTEPAPAPEVATPAPQPPVDVILDPVDESEPRPPKALPETVVIEDVTLRLTQVGLPNTCTKTGTPCDRETGWYAEHDDAAKSGIGYAPSTVAGYFED